MIINLKPKKPPIKQVLFELLGQFRNLHPGTPQLIEMTPEIYTEFVSEASDLSLFNYNPLFQIVTWRGIPIQINTCISGIRIIESYVESDYKKTNTTQS